jgi:peptide chain release factor 1
MNPEDKVKFTLNLKDITKKYIRSSGAGGQNVNKVASCVQLTHVPTGIQVKVQDTRDQCKNEEIAYQRLSDKLKQIEEEKHYNKIESRRKDQIGDGKRGVKRRTYRIKDDIVIDHITGKQCRWKDIMKGKIELLQC